MGPYRDHLTVPTRFEHHHHYVKGGVGLGGVLAAIMSWTVNKSVLWAIVHFFCSWVYVCYCACAHQAEIGRSLDEPVQAPSASTSKESP